MRLPILETILLCAAWLAAVPAHAGVPPFTADCAPGLQVRADAQGAVRINGRPARLMPRPDGQTMALAGGIFIDITPQGSASPRVTYTARDKSTGSCAVVSFDASNAAAAPPSPLAGTRWRLVEFQSMDDRQGTKRPHDPSLYTMQLGADGRVQMQLNCNRAQGDWTAEPAADRSSGRFQFGPLAATRAMCPPPSMDELIVAQAPYVRGYLLKDGRLYLSLMADGGIFAWEPAAPGDAAAACRPPQRVMGATPAQVRSHFAADGREVVTFMGYSGAGYEDHAAMLLLAERVLGRLDPKRAVINIGATEDGIGAVYAMAKQRGFATTGIVSMEAARTGAELSPCVDRVFFVDDTTWGGYLPGTQTLSPTSEAMVTSSNRIVAIGGGEVARDELLAARRLGKPVTFIPADMNHALAVKKAAHRGEPLPTDFRGAAGQAMQAGPR